MRKFILVLCLATGCLFGDHSHDSPANPGGSNPTRPDAGIVVDATPYHPPDACTSGCWVWFQFGTATPFGVGTEFELGLDKNGIGAVVIESSDPTIAEVVAVVLDGTSKHVVVRGKSVGTTTLTARHGDTNAILGTVTLTVEYVATVQLEYRSGPGLDGPVTSLASLSGAEDSFAIVYRNAAGNRLGGRGGIVMTGGVMINPAGIAFRASDLYSGGAHVRVPVLINSSGTLATTLAGDPRQFVWPITVVAAPATISLVPMWLDTNNMLAPLPAAGVKVGHYVGADIIGKTSDGRYVVGVEAVWSAPQGLTPTFSTPTEGVFKAELPGTYLMSANTGATTFTQQIVVIP